MGKAFNSTKTVESGLAFFINRMATKPGPALMINIFGFLFDGLRKRFERIRSRKQEVKIDDFEP